MKWMFDDIGLSVTDPRNTPTPGFQVNREDNSVIFPKRTITVFREFEKDHFLFFIIPYTAEEDPHYPPAYSAHYLQCKIDDGHAGERVLHNYNYDDYYGIIEWAEKNLFHNESPIYS